MNAISGGSWGVESYEPINEANVLAGRCGRWLVGNDNIGYASPVHHHYGACRKAFEEVRRRAAGRR
jgi:hypothetical protein